MTFTEWKDNADMPRKLSDGTWIDMETGIAFGGTTATRAAPSKEVKRAQESRKAAKALGGKALKGTAKQKSWAEDLRKRALSILTPVLAERVLNSEAMQDATFWINNKNSVIDVKFFMNFFSNCDVNRARYTCQGGCKAANHFLNIGVEKGLDDSHLDPVRAVIIEGVQMLEDNSRDLIAFEDHYKRCGDAFGVLSETLKAMRIAA